MSAADIGASCCLHIKHEAIFADVDVDDTNIISVASLTRFVQNVLSLWHDERLKQFLLVSSNLLALEKFQLKRSAINRARRQLLRNVRFAAFDTSVVFNLKAGSHYTATLLRPATDGCVSVGR